MGRSDGDLYTMRGRAFLDILPLLAPIQTEASVRTQIGRLYYGVYNIDARQRCGKMQNMIGCTYG